MFGDPIDPSVIPLPDGAVILRPHWQYSVKRSGVRRSRMCANGSKKAAPTLHAVASTWSSRYCRRIMGHYQSYRMKK